MSNPAPRPDPDNLIVVLTDGVGNVIEKWNYNEHVALILDEDANDAKEFPNLGFGELTRDEARDIAISDISEEVYDELRKRT